VDNEEEDAGAARAEIRAALGVPCPWMRVGVKLTGVVCSGKNTDFQLGVTELPCSFSSSPMKSFI
jgi:hypothetical protein